MMTTTETAANRAKAKAAHIHSRTQPQEERLLDAHTLARTDVYVCGKKIAKKFVLASLQFLFVNVVRVVRVF